MEPKTKIYIFGALLLALIILAYYLYKSNSTSTTQVTTGGSTQTQTGAGGLFGAISELIGNVHFGQNLGISGIGVNQGANAGGYTGGTNAPATCDPNKCDPDHPGYNMCGDFRILC